MAMIALKHTYQKKQIFKRQIAVLRYYLRSTKFLVKIIVYWILDEETEPSQALKSTSQEKPTDKKKV